MSDLEQSKTIKLELDSETERLIQKHDYIKVGDKYFISKDRATQLANKLANEQLETTEPALPIDNVSVSVCYFEQCLDQYNGKCLHSGMYENCRSKQTER